ncbi:MAG: hypothetical protein COT91_03380 [Candidatus Doudnabacteria bacterium CG10_big_fil_rev_8_21_14_0_10_41_10]|uniref:MIP18 family-like domain-containing protein n=1 Tax=Candidatus Doudnabacteria bacterium CG10_big_fil_rev_8_21_14_0_10_41_10 TaxID=1974551 RepID=A0A2H0VD65_9BACT|nr:MAG: hypothetical protein COT91_03380 [Candidatus Doudnabacteria bacterium CG10_big_fil_rev_8_21_14_0_10_41_10]
MTKENILKKLNDILDPDIGIGLVDLGLIYNVTVKNQDIDILMTLTTPYCPFAQAFERGIEKKLSEISNVGKIFIKFTFDPPWNKDRISEEAKMKLGLLS